MKAEQQLLAIALLLSFSIASTSGLCNVCNQQNNLACVNETSYKLCTGNHAMLEKIFHCPVGQACSILTDGCFDEQIVKSQLVYGCRLNICTPCSPLNMSVMCTGRSTFKMCFNGEAMEQQMHCDQDFVCDVELTELNQYPCVPWQADVRICEEEITTSTTTSTTIVPTVSSPDAIIQQICVDNAVVGRFHYPNDPTCTTYVHCSSVSGERRGSLVSCPIGSYFSSGTCLATKPSGCS